LNNIEISDIHRNQFPYTREIHLYNKEKELLFCIPDGGFIQLLYGNGEYTCALCRWLDDSHTEINGHKFHNYSFAEQMEKRGIYLCQMPFYR